MAALFGRHERSYECPLIGGIALQNSQNAGRLIFRGKTKQATIADQCSLKPATGIACEFTRGGVVPHTIIRSSLLRLVEFEPHFPKRLFPHNKALVMCA